MAWYALEPLVTVDVARFAALAETTRMPLIRRHIARRIAESTDDWPGLDTLLPVLARISAPGAQADLLGGILRGLEGRRSVRQPAAWRATYERLQSVADESVHELSMQLALVFDDPVALSTLRHVASDVQADAASRQRAIAALVGKHVAGFDQTLLTLVGDPQVRGQAIRGLAEYRHAATAEVLLRDYAEYSPSERQDVVQTLAARREWAAALLDAVAAGRVPRSDLTAFSARQIRSHDDEALSRRLSELWGEIRETPAERARQVTDWKKRLTADVLAAADPSAGRVHFKKLCANCHRLFDDGGEIGPNITGSQRRNLDYLLENILDPSASVSRDYQLETLVTDAGRVITGLVLAESETALTVATVNERIIVPVSEIEQRRKTSASLMPEGLLNGLTTAQVRDLVRYLSEDRQVP